MMPTEPARRPWTLHPRNASNLFNKINLDPEPCWFDRAVYEMCDNGREERSSSDAFECDPDTFLCRPLRDRHTTHFPRQRILRERVFARRRWQQCVHILVAPACDQDDAARGLLDTREEGLHTASNEFNIQKVRNVVDKIKMWVQRVWKIVDISTIFHTLCTHSLSTIRGIIACLKEKTEVNVQILSEY